MNIWHRFANLCDMMVADAALLRDVVSLHSFSVILLRHDSDFDS